MLDIDSIILLLDCNNPIEQQRDGLSLARNVRCLKAFFQPVMPGYSKNVWENCAHIVCERSDEELAFYLIDMLFWIQDINWPGAMQILDRLKTFKDARSIALILEQYLIPSAIATDDECWLWSLAKLLDNPSLLSILRPSTIDTLNRYRHGW